MSELPMNDPRGDILYAIKEIAASQVNFVWETEDGKNSAGSRISATLIFLFELRPSIPDPYRSPSTSFLCICIARPRLGELTYARDFTSYKYKSLYSLLARSEKSFIFGVGCQPRVASCWYHFKA